MIRKLSAGLLSLGILAVGGTAVQAATLTILSNAPGVDGVAGNQTTSAPLFGVSSWQANSATSLDSPQKSQVYIDPALLFGHSITVGDIASMSYFTNKAGNAGSVDWSLNIYTKPGTGTGGDTGSFYHSHLTSEPYLTNTSNANDPSGLWHQWSTNDPTNPLRFYDSQRDGGVFGTYTDPTLGDLKSGNNPAASGNFKWPNNTSNNYNSEIVKYISFQTGSAWAAGFSGLLDGFNISLTDAETGAINFEAAPLPSSVWGGLLLLGAVGAMKLRRKNSIA